LAVGDIIFEVSGGTQGRPVGRTLYVSERLKSAFDGDVMCASFCKKLRPNPDAVVPIYLFWALQYLYVAGVVAQYQVQSTGISNFRFEDFIDDEILPLPSRSDQQKIAAVLSAYDDLIGINRGRIRILEAMAQTIYREWFIELRFPAYDHVPIVESAHGLVPEGWEWKPLFEVVEPTFGFPFQSNLFNTIGEGTPIIRIRDIPPNRTETFTTEVAPAKCLVEDGDLLVGMDGDFHMGKWAGGRSYLNQRVVRFRPVDGILSRYHAFLAMRQPIRDLNQSIIGTTVAHLGKRHLEDIMLLVPTAQVRSAAGALFNPLFEQELILRNAVTNLIATRELLLPRLVSGEVDASGVDVDTSGLVE
jgi:type I restriction enzyme, S subunit